LLEILIVRAVAHFVAFVAEATLSSTVATFAFFHNKFLEEPPIARPVVYEVPSIDAITKVPSAVD
jgi:hypothetical protein